MNDPRRLNFYLAFRDKPPVRHRHGGLVPGLVGLLFVIALWIIALRLVKP